MAEIDISTSQQTMLFIPDTMESWPYERAFNPYYNEAVAESRAWFSRYAHFTKQFDFHDDLGRCDCGLLCARMYPSISKERLRWSIDLMQFFVFLDEYTDLKPVSFVEDKINLVLDTTIDPYKPRPEGEDPLGQMAQDMLQLALMVSTENAGRHFIETFVQYLESLIQQAKNRVNDSINTLEEFFHNRRLNSGTAPSYVPVELHLNLPDETFYHPAIKDMELLVVDMICIDNDIFSYNREQAINNDHCNIITILMRHYNLDVARAMNWARNYHVGLQAKYLAGLKNVPSFGPQIDKDVKEYLDGIAMMVKGNVCWSFEGRRYFGDIGPDVQRTRYVPLRPKVTSCKTFILELPLSPVHSHL